ncbi:sortase [Candidatus Uhrbacteria bacterium]|nr:sortase [Candidatus Uhrbacteria bacterium]
MEPGQKILAGSLAVCFVVVIMNSGYFLAHLDYAMAPPHVSPPLVATTTAQEVGEPNRLTIESLGIDAPIVYIDEKNEAAYQSALKKGVVHFPGTAFPGELGNVYIFGHSSDFSWAESPFRSIFALLTEIKVGDAINISDSEGRIFHYYVTGTKVVSPKDLSVLDQYGDKKKMLTLQTSYPLGTALRRFLVVAESD